MEKIKESRKKKSHCSLLTFSTSLFPKCYATITIRRGIHSKKYARIERCLLMIDDQFKHLHNKDLDAGSWWMDSFFFKKVFLFSWFSILHETKIMRIQLTTYFTIENLSENIEIRLIVSTRNWNSLNWKLNGNRK